MKGYSNVGAVCFDCAKKAGFKFNKTAASVWTDECGICHEQKPCTNLWHDWNPPKNNNKTKTNKGE